MILPQLILRHLKHRDDAGFYLLQAQDAIRWLESKGVVFNSQTKVLDLGCGHGVFGAELVKRGCQVVFADEDNFLLPEISDAPFQKINIDKEDVSTLGKFDVVICSNVLEHLEKPYDFIKAAASLLTPSGHLYLSWTNWLSPWGGHEFSPFHFLGVKRGHLIFDKITGKKRFHTPYINLYPTYIGETLREIRTNRQVRVKSIAPRYYPEFAFLMHLPVVREFLAWNCAVLVQRNS